MHISILKILFFTSLFLSTAAYSSTRINGYEVMRDDQEAINWVSALEVRLAKSQSRQERKVVPSEDPRYVEIKKSLNLIWEGYEKAFPKNTFGLPAPIPVLIEDPTVNAYALYRSTTNELPLLFVVHTGALITGEDAQLGLYAHELGHLVTKNIIPNVAEQIAKYYLIKSKDEPLGVLQKNNPIVEKYAKRYIDLAKTVGPLARRAFNGNIVDAYGNADYGLLQKFIISKYQTPYLETNLDCKAASAYMQGTIAILDPRLNTAAVRLDLQAEEESKVSALTLEFNKAFESCIGFEKPDLLRLTQERTGLSLDEARRQTPAKDVLIFDAAKTIWQGFLAITLPREVEFEDIARVHDLKNTRVYTFEENADESAALALRSMGRSSEDLASFLYSHMTPMEAEKCKAQLVAGTVPEYGPLFDPHHSTCYRIYHLREFDKQ